MVGKRQRCEIGARAFLDIEAEVSDEEFGSDEEILDDEEDVGEYTLTMDELCVSLLEPILCRSVYY